LLKKRTTFTTLQPFILNILIFSTLYFFQKGRMFATNEKRLQLSDEKVCNLIKKAPTLRGWSLHYLRRLFFTDFGF